MTRPTTPPALAPRAGEGEGRRMRMAWAVLTTAHAACDGPSIVYAPTREKARAQTIASMRDAWDCGFMDATRAIRSIRRAPERDVALPPRHPLAGQIGDKLLALIVHAYGGKSLKAGRRDHFYTRTDDTELVELTRLGLFERGRTWPATVSGGEPHAYFLLTDLGKLVAAGEQPEYPDAG